MHDNLSKDQQKKIKEFVVAALEYNKTHNIFSRETEEEVYKKDVLDCMPLVEKIKNQNITQAEINETKIHKTKI